jgi:hypothetical protein
MILERKLPHLSEQMKTATSAREKRYGEAEDKNRLCVKEHCTHT